MSKLLLKRRLVTMLLAVVMIFTMSSTAFATVDHMAQTMYEHYSGDTSVTPRAVETLGGIDDLIFQETSQAYRVYPTKGRNLKIILVNYGEPVTVKVTKNGGWWPSKTFRVKETGVVATYDLIENCNGEPYTIQFESVAGHISFTVVQTEYI